SPPSSGRCPPAPGACRRRRARRARRARGPSRSRPLAGRRGRGRASRALGRAGRRYVPAPLRAASRQRYPRRPNDKGTGTAPDLLALVTLAQQVACQADLARASSAMALRALGSRSDGVGARGPDNREMRSGIGAFGLLTLVLSSCVANTG